MPPARRTYASPSYASPPLPVFVTEADLPRVIAVVVFGTLAASWLALQLDAYFAADGRHDDFYFPYERTVALEALSMAMACYLCVTIDSSMPVMWTYILYEVLWGCNIAIVLVIMAVFLSKPFLVGVAMAIVSGDQLLWYIDIISYALTGKFITGVLKYLTYPENRSFSKTFFASHHIWFLPLCLWITVKHGGMHPSSFAVSCVITTFVSVFCRMFTPFEAKVRGSDHIIYLNINGAFEFWKDIDIGVLHVFDHRHPLLYLPYLAVVGNLIANGIPHIVLMGISLTLQFHPLLQG